MVNSSIKAVRPQKCFAKSNNSEGWSSGTSFKPYVFCRRGISAAGRPASGCTVNSSSTAEMVFVSYGLAAAVIGFAGFVMRPGIPAAVVKLGGIAGLSII